MGDDILIIDREQETAAPRQRVRIPGKNLEGPLPPWTPYPIKEILPGIFVDLHRKELIISSEFTIRGLENLTIKTEKHLFLESGKNPEPDRPGYNYSIWNNQQHFDAQGRPVEMIPVWDAEDKMHLMIKPLTPEGHEHRDEHGFFVLPEGFFPLPKDAREHHAKACSSS